MSLPYRSHVACCAPRRFCLLTHSPVVVGQTLPSILHAGNAHLHGFLQCMTCALMGIRLLLQYIELWYFCSHVQAACARTAWRQSLTSFNVIWMALWSPENWPTWSLMSMYVPLSRASYPQVTVYIDRPDLCHSHLCMLRCAALAAVAESAGVFGACRRRGAGGPA
jgi:hypothetical protein